MRAWLFAIVSLLPLVACDPAPTPAPVPKPSAAPDPVEARIDALPRPLQQVTLFRAILGGGYTCQKILRFEKHAPVKGPIGSKPTWIAECDDHGQYVIELQPGGIFWVSGVPQPKTL